MKCNVLSRFAIVAAAVSMVAVTSLRAQAKQCSQATGAGNWAYTYNGTVFAPDAAPIAAVGHYHQDAKGNVIGGQTHTLAGQTEVEDITATATVNSNCTGKATINVYLQGTLLRTTTVDVAYDSDGNHVRMIFTSLTLSDGTVLPVVATLDGNRVATKP
jgi:hypothetical protein